MSTVTKPFYAARCDYPGCSRIEDGGEYTYWDDPQWAIDGALQADWYQEADSSGDRLFCTDHALRVHWRSDEVPEPDGEDARVLTLPDGKQVVLA